jgi:hypothetical protein
MISDITFKQKYQQSGSDGKDLVAEYDIATDIGISIRATERNTFDVGYQTFVWATSVDVQIDDWVNDAIVKVTSVKDTETDAIQYKFVAELYTDVLTMKSEKESIDVVVWSKNPVETEIQEGDLLYIDSVVCDTYQSEKYLSYNSSSTVEKVTRDTIRQLDSKIRSYLTNQGVITTQVRL